MSQLEDRLRTALAEAPSPPTTTVNPLADLDRRIGRARLRLGGIAMVAVIVVVLAIVVPVALFASNHVAPPVHRAQKVAVQTWPGKVQAGPVAGGGFVWTLAQQPTSRRENERVQRRDPQTGGVLQTYRVPQSSEFITYGLGRVWTWGGGDGGYPNGELGMLDPASGALTVAHLGYGKGLSFTSYGFNSLVFAHGKAFGLRESGGGVVEFDPNHLGAAGPNQPALAVGTGELLLAGHHEINVWEPSGSIRQWSTTGVWPPSRPQAQGRIDGIPVAITADGVWAAQGRSLAHQTLSGRQIGSPIELPAGIRSAGLKTPVSIAFDPAGGFYVGLANGGTSGDSLLYYPPAALKAAHPAPTAVGHVDKIDQLVADPVGGVVVGSGGIDDYNKDSVSAWDPAGG